VQWLKTFTSADQTSTLLRQRKKLIKQYFPVPANKECASMKEKDWHAALMPISNECTEEKKEESPRKHEFLM
jgi:hypothetical protein